MCKLKSGEKRTNFQRKGNHEEGEDGLIEWSAEEIKGEAQSAPLSLLKPLFLHNRRWTKQRERCVQAIHPARLSYSLCYNFPMLHQIEQKNQTKNQ